MIRTSLGAPLVVALALGCHSRTSLGPPRVEDVFGEHVPAVARVVFETELGAVHCTLQPRLTPHAMALVIGLARGVASFRDERTGEITRRPYYDGLSFHRRIDGVLVQSGCPRGDGTGTPGYRIPVESDPGDLARLATPGVLLLARYTPPPRRVDPAPPPPGDVIGSQFVIALRPMVHLVGQVTVLGRCSDLDVVLALSRVPRGSTPPRLLRARVE